MAWKIYFWAYFAIFVFGLIGLIFQISKLSLGDWVSYINSVVVLFGAYVYIFKKTNYYTWKKLFLANLILFAILVIDYYLFSENLLGSILPSLKSSLEVSQGAVLFGIITSIPAIYANFKLITGK